MAPPLVLALVDLVGDRNHPGVVMISKFRIGQRQFQLKIKRSQRRGLAKRFNGRRILLKRQLRASTIQVGVREMVIKRDRLCEFAVGLLVFAEFEMRRTERIMRRDKLRIDVERFIEVFYCALKILLHQKLISPLVFAPCLAGRFQIQTRYRAVGTLDFGGVGIPAADQEEVEVESPLLNGIK